MTILNSEIGRSNDLNRCPISKTHKRLVEAHLLWHQALGQYHEPINFHANLNALIQALRNITFVLQSDKRTFKSFDEWYGPWQEKMKADPLLRWLIGARNTVVKKGELETSSTARVKLVTWRDHLLIESELPPEMPGELLLRNIQLLELIKNIQIPPGDIKNAAVTIERCWSAPGLEGREILDALAQAYGFLSDLVFDAHVCLAETSCISSSQGGHTDFRSVQHRTGTLPCMVLGVEERTQTFKLSSSERLEPVITRRPVTAAEVAQSAERYELGKDSQIATWQEADPVLLAERIMFRAKRILRKDRYHDRIMFIRDGHGVWHRVAMDAKNRTEKHLLMREVARFIESVGGDAIIDVGEAWMLLESESAQVVDPDRLQEAPGRKEVLYVLVATRDGLIRTYNTPFTRGPFGGIKLGETVQDEQLQNYYLAPVLEVWFRQGTIKNAVGTRIRRIWDPDPLDICYCGGPKCFGECCKRLLDSEAVRKSIQSDFDSSMEIRDFVRAERLARAALAQYVIWVRQHTAPTMHVARDLHQQIVEIDVGAVDAHIRQMARALVANQHSDSFLPQLRHVIRIIGVPELSIRVTALVAQWLFDMGDMTAASQELEVLGDLENVSDTLALVLAAKLFDWPPHKKTAYFTRAASGAYNQGEKFFAELAAIEHLVACGDRVRALQKIDLIIGESAGLTLFREQLADALILRWKITQDEDDFQTAKNQLELFTDPVYQQELAIMLLDHGDFDHVQNVLSESLAAGDPLAQLVMLDGYLRGGQNDAAHQMLLRIPADDLPNRLRLAYAVAYSHVALSKDDPEMKAIAAAKLRELSLSGTHMSREINNLLAALENQSIQPRRADIMSRLRDLLIR